MILLGKISAKRHFGRTFQSNYILIATFSKSMQIYDVFILCWYMSTTFNFESMEGFVIQATEMVVFEDSLRTEVLLGGY